MSTTSTIRAEPSARPTVERGILVWDLPVRVFHWLMALSFAGAWVTAESERWRLAHVTLGYTMAGLVVFRLVWGLVGSRHARFADFVRGPRAAMHYLRTLLSAKPEHHTGHNPAGAWVIVALLSMAVGLIASGWAVYNDVGPRWLEEAHEVAASLMLAVVGVHIAGVVVSSWLHRENLVRAMITGRKPGRSEDGVRSAWRTLGVLMLVAVLGFWWMQWQWAPAVAVKDGKTVHHQRLDDDD